VLSTRETSVFITPLNPSSTRLRSCCEIDDADDDDEADDDEDEDITMSGDDDGADRRIVTG
jgi:hypothetical protein